MTHENPPPGSMLDQWWSLRLAWLRLMVTLYRDTGLKRFSRWLARGIDFTP